MSQETNGAIPPGDVDALHDLLQSLKSGSSERSCSARSDGEASHCPPTSSVEGSAIFTQEDDAAAPPTKREARNGSRKRSRQQRYVDVSKLRSKPEPRTAPRATYIPKDLRSGASHGGGAYVAQPMSQATAGHNEGGGMEPMRRRKAEQSTGYECMSMVRA